MLSGQQKRFPAQSCAMHEVSSINVSMSEKCPRGMRTMNSKFFLPPSPFMKNPDVRQRNGDTTKPPTSFLTLNVPGRATPSDKFLLDKSKLVVYRCNWKELPFIKRSKCARKSNAALAVENEWIKSCSSDPSGARERMNERTNATYVDRRRVYSSPPPSSSARFAWQTDERTDERSVSS